ncbi:4'-phosphopantetheinyl transferase family protein [Marinomonas posidonica]|uniref:Enterobactin synthase component D n=1 Tax=Marinomonas posidonica (strain CECT 7376 / NCIMB 14433 / IVIA-Po-181) TaxID=491952 RepID=F6CU80_MARPP|nr:4'-phosphopantetheinyl transferase superfamily protein [Marinomonas posidonica]AEF55199.1 4'-phosphopantetheinyl transferase [Marinomonas posidonica IVIA-Po-181]
MKNNNQTCVHFKELGDVLIHHVCFEQGNLIANEHTFNIKKPNEYPRWRSKRKETYLAGRLAVQLAQSTQNFPLFDVIRGNDGAPIWPIHYIGSISHTDNEAVAIVIEPAELAIKGIGIDIEKVQCSTQLYDRGLIGESKEYDLLKKVGFDESMAALILFSLKESVYKALYPSVKRYFDFLDAELVELEGDRCIVRTKVTLSDSVPAGFLVKATFRIQNANLLSVAYW